MLASYFPAHIRRVRLRTSTVCSTVAIVIQAYRFALEPTRAQELSLRSHCGAQRFAFNWGLALVRANLGQREAERSYGIGDKDLTPPIGWSAFALRRLWNQAKRDAAPWWAENSKEAYSSGLANLAAALANWSDSRDGERAGARVRFPRFKGKRAGLSCRFTTGSIGLARADCRHVQLPRIGLVRTGESTRKLARRIASGAARIRSATVSLRSGRWFVSLSVEVDRVERGSDGPNSAIGVDLGVKSLAVLSSGEVVSNPKHLDRAQKELRRLQRQLARRRGRDRRRGSVPSNRWLAVQARIAILHARVADSRRDGIHKLTTRLVREHRTVVVEDLNVAGMLANRRLARRIADAGFGELRRQLDYKLRWSGGTLLVADRWYPSSKSCSACGVVKAKLRLAERTFACDSCGLVLDRDLNAARNLVGLVATSSASCVGTKNLPAGNPRKSCAMQAMGIATGRPDPWGPGQRRRSNSLAQDRRIITS
ncbi:IS607 family element RNA-guided endonuclease TnpB [Nocardia sp. NPDC005825]|uniref:IS607 family element RNA-guided endonuclease TnpB n=1 Tax=unclassified Nocardia TaxID=2637762 RepID=UPI0033FEEBFD